MSFYIWRRGAGQRILAGGEGRRSCGPQPPEPAIPLTAPRQGRGESRWQLLLAPRLAGAHFSFAFIRGFGPLNQRPATPGTSITIDRAPAGPNSGRAAENHAGRSFSRRCRGAFLLCFYPGVRAAKPAALTPGYNSWHRPAVPAPQSGAKCRNSRAREGGDRKGRQIPSPLRGLVPLAADLSHPAGRDRGLSSFARFAGFGAPFMNKENFFRSPCPPPFQAHLCWKRSHFQAHSWIGKCWSSSAAHRGSWACKLEASSLQPNKRGRSGTSATGPRPEARAAGSAADVPLPG